MVPFLLVKRSCIIVDRLYFVKICIIIKTMDLWIKHRSDCSRRREKCLRKRTGGVWLRKEHGHKNESAGVLA